MIKGDDLFWVASPQKAATQIMSAIERQCEVAYVTRRWRGLALLLATLPGWLYRRIA